MTDRVVTGGELARHFHADVVAPLLARAMPRLGYAAGRLGSGSGVLGFDDAMSRDHDWGCRLTLLVDEADRDAVPRISELLERELPAGARGVALVPGGHRTVRACRGMAAALPGDADGRPHRRAR